MRQLVALLSILTIAHAGILLGNSGGSNYGESGLGLGHGGISSISLSNLAIAGKETVIDHISPPKYEFKYAVSDSHTGDQKEQAESRVHDLTKSEYGLVEKDRKIQVSRIIHGNIPVKIVGKY